MSVTALQNSESVSLQLVTDKIKSKLLVETHIKAVGDSIDNLSTSSLSPAKKLVTGRFTITFSFEQNLHRTQVQVTQGGYGAPVYKVALNSTLSEKVNICWLQHAAEGWNVLLGTGISSNLKKALITAIEQQA